MKANEAPEKIYLSAIDLEEVGHLLTESNDRDDVEYVRTDVFIEKATNFLNYELDVVVAVRGFGSIIPHHVAKQDLIEDFKKYMKGE